MVSFASHPPSLLTLKLSCISLIFQAHLFPFFQTFYSFSFIFHPPLSYFHTVFMIFFAGYPLSLLTPSLSHSFLIFHVLLLTFPTFYSFSFIVHLLFLAVLLFTCFPWLSLSFPLVTRPVTLLSPPLP